MPDFALVAMTFNLQAPFTAITALIIWRVWRVYGGRALGELTAGWALWTARMVVASVIAVQAQAGVGTHAPIRRALSALGIAVVLGALPFMVSGTLAVANVARESPWTRRIAGWLALVGSVLSLVFSAERVPASYRIALLLFSTTVAFAFAFGYVAWKLLRHPADELTVGRQIAAFGFGSYALKQVVNVFSYLNGGASMAQPSVVSENIVLIMAAMGTVALLFERERERAVQAVHEQRRLEAELAERTRLDSLGRLAGGVAHDFNNMLTAIIGNVQQARAEMGVTSPIEGELSDIESTANRAAALTRQLLAVARREQVRPAVFDVVQRVESLRRYLHRQAGASVAFDVQLPLRALHVEADPDRFDQMVINLVANARDALDGTAGTVSLSVLAAPAALDGRDAVLVRVLDTGSGMDEAVRARIFEPFFTTKSQERGTGLGLASVHGAVSQAGGRIDVVSAPGAGSRFDILLPSAEPVGAVTDLAGGDQTPVRRAVVVPDVRISVVPGERTVLVVDDDPLVRRVAVRILRRAGYLVCEAEDAEEAMVLHAAFDGRIDLLLTDLMMPGPNGRDLATRLVLRDPQLTVAYMSGYDADAARDGDHAPVGPFIAKPFREQQLLDGVRAALGIVAE